MAAQLPFYHRDTERKLRVVQDYLERFLTVMSNQTGLQTVYIDAFAGSGTIPAPSHQSLLVEVLEADELAVGSALRAAGLERKFSKYIFIEKNPSKLNELRSRIENLASPPSTVEYLRGDANDELLRLCPLLSKKNVRSVVFLDPFGNQVRWGTLDALARTKHVDLWYLFPAMLGVYRQIGNMNAKMTREQEGSLDALFGPHDWRQAFIRRTKQYDLFGESEIDRKAADVNSITRFQIECLESIFEGGVLNRWLPLGRNGQHWYSLIFAMANPSSKAVRLGHDIARHLMTHG